MVAPLIKIAVGATTWAVEAMVPTPIRAIANLARYGGDVLSKRGQTPILISTKVWVCQSLLTWAYRKNGSSVV